MPLGRRVPWYAASVTSLEGPMPKAPKPEPKDQDKPPFRFDDWAAL